MEKPWGDNLTRKIITANDLDIVDSESGQIEIDPELEKPFVDKEGLLIQKEEQLELMYMDRKMQIRGVNWGEAIEIE